MERSSRNRTWLACGVLVVIALCAVAAIALGGGATLLAFVGASASTSTPEPPVAVTVPVDASPSPLPLSDIPFEAVVQISAMADEGDGLEVSWTGSGSIISPDGYILTNAHVVLPDKYYPVDALMVSLTVREDAPPEPMYFAEVLQADETLDIAVIRVTTDLDGNPVDYGALNLPTVPLGDSDDLRLGDRINILGYPGIGGATITLTGGDVSGFTSEPGRGERAFIKTSATIAGGNSGGLAANPEGELIGIPTQLGYGGEDQFVDCRVLADTNRDGIIDDRDSCIPTGGFINALRPLELALPLIEAAKQGEVEIVTDSGIEQEGDLPQPGEVLFQDDFSSPASGWDQGESENGSVGYVNDEYHIEVLPDNYIFWANPGEYFSDVVVDVDVRVIRITGEGDFGVICRYQDEDNYYALEVTEDGYYSIWKYVDGEFSVIVEWEPSDLIPQDDSSFWLTASCVGDTLGMAVGGVPLVEAHDSSFSEGDVGLVAGTWNVGGLRVGFDNFVVSAPGP